MIAAVPTAHAQEISGAKKIALDGVEFVTGLMDFDLSGTGQTMPFAVRGSKSLTNRLALEFGATILAPQETFARTTMWMPEAQLSYSWRIGPVRPFVSGGGGVAATQLGPFTRWRSSLTGGGGARVQISDRLHVVGEMRLRGLTRNFGASTAEWLGGIGWSLR